jgi:hypothetical protein
MNAVYNNAVVNIAASHAKGGSVGLSSKGTLSEHQDDMYPYQTKTYTKLSARRHTKDARVCQELANSRVAESSQGFIIVA